MQLNALIDLFLLLLVMSVQNITYYVQKSILKKKLGTNIMPKIGGLIENKSLFNFSLLVTFYILHKIGFFLLKTLINKTFLLHETARGVPTAACPVGGGGVPQDPPPDLGLNVKQVPPSN